MQAESDSKAEAGRAVDLFRVGVVLVALYFVGRLVFLATSLHPFVPPDEVDWFGRSVAFAQTLGIPDDTESSARFGLIRHEPYLYFWLMGRVLSLHPTPEQGLLLARLANLPLALVAFFYVCRLTGLLLRDRLARIVVLVTFTNTLQVTHLFATVTYDNLCAALAAAVLCYLFTLYRDFSARTFASFVLVSALACLTKLAMLPLVSLATLFLLVARRRTWRRDLRELVRELRAPRHATRAVAAAALVACGLAAALYGGNLLRFGKLQVFATEALPLEWALENRIVRRSWVTEQFRIGALTYEQAQEEIAKIPNRGNRNRALRIVAELRAGGGAPRRVASLPTYAVAWSRLMRDRLFGFHGNGSFHVPPMYVLQAVVFPVALLTVVGWLLRVRSETGWEDGLHLLALFTLYATVLLFVTYPAHRDFGPIDYSVNGRYLIPVLPLAYIAAARYCLEPLRRGLRVAVAIGVGWLFVASDVPYLLDSMSACWFADVPASVRCVF